MGVVAIDLPLGPEIGDAEPCAIGCTQFRATQLLSTTTTTVGMRRHVARNAMRVGRCNSGGTNKPTTSAPDQASERTARMGAPTLRAAERPTPDFPPDMDSSARLT